MPQACIGDFYVELNLIANLNYFFYKKLFNINNNKLSLKALKIWNDLSSVLMKENVKIKLYILMLYLSF